MRLLGRVAGFLLMIAGGAGLLFCLVGIYVGIQALGRAEESVTSALTRADQALVEVDDGLRVAGTSLFQADQTVSDVQSTIDNVNQTITDTLPLVNSLGTVVGTDVPQTIRATQQALNSAQSTALIADGILGAVSRIGLISSQVYNPSVPLSSAIGQISASLNDLPTALEGMRGDITAATGNMQRLQGDTAQLAANIDTIKASLSDARDVVSGYQDIIEDLRTDLASLQTSVPDWFNGLRWGGALLLIWLGAAQIGLMTQGWELVKRSRASEDPAASLEHRPLTVDEG
jgi:phage-related tail protein